MMDQPVSEQSGNCANVPYILINRITKSYNAYGLAACLANSILYDFSLEVFQHEFLTIIGPNGCGKSTLLKLIAGLDNYDSGCISIPSALQRKLRIGFVFQDYQNTLYPWKNAIDNIAFPLELNHEPLISRRDRAKEFLKRHKLVIPLDHYPHELSGGQKQLVAIARSLILEPEILILDEPFAHLDFETRISLQLTLMDLWRVQKMTVLFVSHDLDEATLLGDRVVVLTKPPTSVGGIIVNPLPRPRGYGDLKGKSFFEVRRTILETYNLQVKL